ncbi:MAG: hypothetical protein ACJAYN_001904 [Bermanella sp.]|jgi:hypothetical protein|uniref:porin n=1 Tax=Glaciecola sp. 33A TaxID=2057807 RepID=UPI000C33DE6A|nr:porin [Glaciecola sp. 33A]PKI01854.1 porin [Glaciecola sp. 33A]
MKKLLTAVVLLTPFISPTNAVADVTAYGRVIYNVVSDDTSDDVYFGRHEFAESTIGIKGSIDFEGIIFGAQVEIGLDEGVSNILHTESNARNRIQEIWVSGKYGKLKLGTGASITWIASDVDQSGTWWSDPLGMSQRFGSTRRGPTGQSQTPFVQTQSIFSERIAYESPRFMGGIKFYAQQGEDSSREFAVKYAKNGWRANAWVSDFGDTDNDLDPQANIDGNATPGFFGAQSGRGVLAGYKHKSGVNFTATYGESDLVNNSQRDFINGKLGYTKGKHAASVSLGQYGSKSAQGLAGADHDRTTVAYHYAPTKGVRLWIQATQGDTEGQKSFNSFAIGGMVQL